jgi:transposase InsO family protein
LWLLIHDRDHAFDNLGPTAKAMRIEEVLTAPRAPRQNAFVERFIGSDRRECFDHVIVLNEASVRKLMTLYARRWRHLGDPRGRGPPSSVRTVRRLNARRLAGLMPQAARSDCQAPPQ